MIDLSTLLKDADPVAREEAFSPEDASAMRREMLAALPDGAAAGPVWTRPLALAAAAAIVMSVTSIAGHRARSARAVDAVPGASTNLPDEGSSGSLEKRQLQFATPGGTRIIWIFDQSLRLQESLP
jgi:hypothetical protein